MNPAAVSLKDKLCELDAPLLLHLDDKAEQAAISPLPSSLNCTPKVRHKTFGVFYVQTS